MSHPVVVSGSEMRTEALNVTMYSLPVSTRVLLHLTRTKDRDPSRVDRCTGEEGEWSDQTQHLDPWNILCFRDCWCIHDTDCGPGQIHNQRDPAPSIQVHSSHTHEWLEWQTQEETHDKIMWLLCSCLKKGTFLLIDGFEFWPGFEF